MSARDAEVVARVSRPSGPGAHGGVDALELQRRLGLSSRYLAERLLVALGADPGGALAESELLERVRALADAGADERLRFAFRVHDENGDGAIDVVELHKLLHLALVESGIEIGEDAGALVRSMMRHADADGDGAISWEELRRSLEHFPGVLETIRLGDLGTLGMVEPSRPSRAPTRATIAERAVRSHGLTWLLFGGYLAINAALFATAWARYASAGAPLMVQLARGCGACLNFHGAIVLVPMLRSAQTLLGRTRLGRIMIDDHVGFHRVVGSGALYLGVAHAVAHLLNYAAGGDPVTGPIGLAAGLTTWAGATGAALLLVHALIWAFARSPIRRRSGRFELFAITHRLYPLWIVLLAMHGPVAWAWMIVPVTAFVLDRVLGRRVHRARVLGLDALPSGTTRVRIARPATLDYRAADYVFVRIPALSRFEWHPFTISSAPEDSAELTLHVRAVGDWTRELRALAETGIEDLAIDLEGPYGTPTSRASEQPHVVLIAAGIGVTPFASLVRSVLRGGRARCETVHFVWVCREQRAFSWFTDILGEAEKRSDRFTVDVFMDGGRSDAHSMLLRVAMDALYADTRSDLVTGLRSRTTLGAPDWQELLGRFARRHHPDPVVCYFCGPEGLAVKVRAAATAAGVEFHQEHF